MIVHHAKHVVWGCLGVSFWEASGIICGTHQTGLNNVLQREAAPKIGFAQQQFAVLHVSGMPF